MPNDPPSKKSPKFPLGGDFVFPTLTPPGGDEAVPSPRSKTPLPDLPALVSPSGGAEAVPAPRAKTPLPDLPALLSPSRSASSLPSPARPKPAPPPAPTRPPPPRPQPTREPKSGPDPEDAAESQASAQEAADDVREPVPKPDSEPSRLTPALHPPDRSRRRWLLGIGGVAVALVLLLLAIVMSGDGPEDIPAAEVLSPEQALQRHLASLDGSEPSVAYRISVDPSFEDRGVTLALAAGDDRTRQCALLTDGVVCDGGDGQVARSVANQLNLAEGAETLTDDDWLTLAAWLVALNPTVVHRGSSAPGDDTIHLDVIVDLASPDGLAREDVVEALRLVPDYLGPDSLLSLSVVQSGERRLLLSSISAEMFAVEQALSGLTWPLAASAGNASAPTPGAVAQHTLLIVDGAAADRLDPADPNAEASSTLSIVHLGPANAEQANIVFAGEGRLYPLSDRLSLPSAVRHALQWLTDADSFLSSPRVAHSPGSGTMIVLYGYSGEGWRRHAVRVDVAGQITTTSGTPFASDSATTAADNAPTAALPAGTWFDGRLTEWDPPLAGGQPLDRLSLTADSARRWRLEVESDEFAPRLTVLDGSGEGSADAGDERARVELDLQPGTHVLHVSPRDGAGSGAYRVRARDVSDRSGSGRQQGSEGGETESRRESSARPSSTPRASPNERAPASPLSGSDIRGAIRPHLDSLAACATSYHGGVTIDFRLENSGRVAAASAEGPDMPSSVERCLTRAFRDIPFPTYDGPDILSSYLVVF